MHFLRRTGAWALDNIVLVGVTVALTLAVGLESGVEAPLKLLAFGALFLVNGHWMGAIANAVINVADIEKRDIGIAIFSCLAGIVGFTEVSEYLTAVSFVGPAIIVGVMSIHQRFQNDR